MSDIFWFFVFAAAVGLLAAKLLSPRSKKDKYKFSEFGDTVSDQAAPTPTDFEDTNKFTPKTGNFGSSRVGLSAYEGTESLVTAEPSHLTLVKDANPSTSEADKDKGTT